MQLFWWPLWSKVSSQCDPKYFPCLASSRVPASPQYLYIISFILDSVNHGDHKYLDEYSNGVSRNCVLQSPPLLLFSYLFSSSTVNQKMKVWLNFMFRFSDVEFVTKITNLNDIKYFLALAKLSIINVKNCPFFEICPIQTQRCCRLSNKYLELIIILIRKK